MRVAVTGASGFIGGAIATALAHRGHEVVGYGRRPGGWKGPYAQWDLSAGLPPHPDHSWRADAVVHSAALADDWAHRTRAMSVNVDGTRAVVERFAGARIIHLSSSSVYDAFTPTENAVETSRLPVRWLSAYSESKAAAEGVAL